MDNVIMNEPVNGVAMMKPGQSPSPTLTAGLTPGLMASQPKPLPPEFDPTPGKTSSAESGRMPEGIPDTLNLSDLTNHVGKLSVARRMLAKGILGKSAKRMTPENRHRIQGTFPCTSRQVENLNNKQLRMALLVMFQGFRQQLAEKCIEARRPEDQVEVWLVDQWLKARFTKSTTMLTSEVQEKDSGTSSLVGQEVPPTLFGEDALIAALSVNLGGSGFDLMQRMVRHGWIRTMYQDICADNEFADKAASALFAISSMFDCRWPLDLLHQRSPEMHWKHYQTMESFGVKGASVLDKNGKYKPLPFKLDAPSQAAIFNLVSLSPLLGFASQGLQSLSDDLCLIDRETKAHGLEGIRSGFTIMTRGANVFENVVTTLRERLTAMAAATVKEELADLIRTTEVLNSRFRNTFTEFDRDDNQTIEHIQSAQTAIATLADDFGGTVPGREGDLMAATTEAGNRISGKEPVFVKLMEAGDSIRDDITKLAAEDPLRNREEISRCYDRLKEMDAELTAANVEMGFWAQEAGRLANQEIEAWQAHNRRIESEQAAEEARHQSEHEVTQLLEETVAENKDLSSRNLELKARVESLECGLASQRNAQANEGMSDEVREAMQAAMAGGNTLTPEQALLLVKATYPHTEILDSAWSSAHDAAQFEQTDRLWENLSTLAGKYTDAITSGTSDAEARKLFTGYEYAANESETCSAGALRKHREFWYQGEKRFFDQHLKIGAAFDARKTIRIHFKIIDGVLVIAYCGEHRKL